MGEGGVTGCPFRRCHRGRWADGIKARSSSRLAPAPHAACRQPHVALSHSRTQVPGRFPPPPTWSVGGYAPSLIPGPSGQLQVSPLTWCAPWALETRSPHRIPSSQSLTRRLTQARSSISFSLSRACFTISSRHKLRMTRGRVSTAVLRPNPDPDLNPDSNPGSNPGPNPEHREP